ncbi:hypothetical protein GCM10009808_03020 [Microbacterium sediminicola]|uniref:SAF domain-containing protein n=1 Tax=Microbacterium sediminicola TaxID=415210 RepID=A0ABN2HLR6_9MICO
MLGIVLIAGSIAGVWLVVAGARTTEPVYAAAHTLVAGQTVEAGDLVVVDVALGASAGRYLSREPLPGEAVVTRTIRSGELVPADDIVAVATVKTATVVVRTSGDVPASVVPGSVVELWSAPSLGQGEYDAPRILVADVVVAGILDEESVIAGDGMSVEISVPRSDVAGVLDAVAGGDALSIVPTRG